MTEACRWHDDLHRSAQARWSFAEGRRRSEDRDAGARASYATQPCCFLVGTREETTIRIAKGSEMQAFLCLCDLEREWLPCLRRGKRGTQTAAWGRLSLARQLSHEFSCGEPLRTPGPALRPHRQRAFRSRDGLKRMPVALSVPRLDPDRLHIVAHEVVTGGIGERAVARDKRVHRGAIGRPLPKHVGGLRPECWPFSQS